MSITVGSQDGGDLRVHVEHCADLFTRLDRLGDGEQDQFVVGGQSARLVGVAEATARVRQSRGKCRGVSTRVSSSTDAHHRALEGRNENHTCLG